MEMEYHQKLKAVVLNETCKAQDAIVIAQRTMIARGIEFTLTPTQLIGSQLEAHLLVHTNNHEIPIRDTVAHKVHHWVDYELSPEFLKLFMDFVYPRETFLNTNHTAVLAAIAQPEGMLALFRVVHEMQYKHQISYFEVINNLLAGINSDLTTLINLHSENGSLSDFAALMTVQTSIVNLYKYNKTSDVTVYATTVLPIRRMLDRALAEYSERYPN